MDQMSLEIYPLIREEKPRQRHGRSLKSHKQDLSWWKAFQSSITFHYQLWRHPALVTSSGTDNLVLFHRRSLHMNSMKLVVPLHSLYRSIHTKNESKCGTAFAFIFGVNWLWRCGVTASFGVFFHGIHDHHFFPGVADEYTAQLVTWSQFNREPLPGRNFTFWEWFYAILKLTKDWLQGPWKERYVLLALKSFGCSFCCVANF